MNWRRGFVRLSLALSACYVALVVAAIGPNTFTALYRSSAVYEISFESGTTQRFDTSQSRNELLQEIVRAYRAAAAALAAAAAASTAAWLSWYASS